MHVYIDVTNTRIYISYRVSYNDKLIKKKNFAEVKQGSRTDSDHVIAVT